MTDRSTPYVGRSLLRREDRRLLIGRGQFIADLELPRMLHAAFIRSPLAHAHIRSVDLSRAAAAPGVALAISGGDLVRLLPPLPDTQLSVPSKWMSRVQHEFHNPQQPGLAYDKVRHVGEAIAVIVAETRYAAEDAAELATLDLEPLPAVVDPEAALASGAPLIHEHLQTNLYGAFSIAKGDVAAAMAQAPHRLQRRFYHHRYAAMPIECRGVAALHDPRTDTITIWSSTQVVHWVRREVAAILACRKRVSGVWRSMSAAGSASRVTSIPKIWSSRFWRDGSGIRCAGSRTGTSICCPRRIRATSCTRSRSGSTTMATSWR
jgi:carbon-monoxide dehydrogenase large subunit